MISSRGRKKRRRKRMIMEALDEEDQIKGGEKRSLEINLHLKNKHNLATVKKV